MNQDQIFSSLSSKSKFSGRLRLAPKLKKPNISLADVHLTQILEEDTHYQTISSEKTQFMSALSSEKENTTYLSCLETHSKKRKLNEASFEPSNY